MRISQPVVTLCPNLQITESQYLFNLRALGANNCTDGMLGNLQLEAYMPAGDDARLHFILLIIYSHARNSFHCKLYTINRVQQCLGWLVNQEQLSGGGGHLSGEARGRCPEGKYPGGNRQLSCYPQGSR